MEYIEVSGKTLDDAITNACQKLTVTSARLDYEVIEKGSAGFLGIASKPAVIRARIKDENEQINADKVEVKSENKVTDKKSAEKKNFEPGNYADPKEFLEKVFAAMNMDVSIDVKMDEVENEMSIDLKGEEMGVLIGKRGQTLDAIQYLTSLVVNKEKEDYVRVVVDAENYRSKREKTLEMLAERLADKVIRTKKSVRLEPMNPYERKVIHATLQSNDRVTTRSEGQDPYRRVIIELK